MNRQCSSSYGSEHIRVLRLCDCGFTKYLKQTQERNIPAVLQNDNTCVVKLGVLVLMFTPF